MELGKTLNLDGKAAYRPEDTLPHSVAQAFASGIGFDGEGKVVSPDTPMSGPEKPSVAPPHRSGAR